MGGGGFYGHNVMLKEETMITNPDPRIVSACERLLAPLHGMVEENARLRLRAFLEAERGLFRNAEVAKLHDKVDGLAELLRLKDRKALTVAEAARYAGVEPATVRGWLDDGKVQGSKLGQKRQSQWRVNLRSLLRHLERNNNLAGGAAAGSDS